MNPDDYQELDAVAIDELVATGKVSVVEVAAAAQAMHRRTHEDINAILEWYDDPTPCRIAGIDGPSLRGVPILRKDYGEAEAGRLVEMGSRLARGNRATYTSTFVHTLQDAGAQFVGRSAVPEFIQHGVTDSQLHGVTRNPHDLTVSAGGSSGGAAAAVAAGVVPIAHASDCAGSIRIPAAACGLVGLKPGRGRVPIDHDWNGIAQQFVVARTIRDARRCLSVLGVGDYAPVPTSVRCAVSTAHWAGMTVDPQISAAVDRVADLLAARGHLVDRVDQPVSYRVLMRSWPASFSQFAFDDSERVASQMGRPIDAATLEPMTLAARAVVQTMSAVERAQSVKARGEVVAQLETAMDGYDVLLTPTLARTTIPLDGVGGHAEPQGYFERNDEIFPFNYLFNLAGWPSISVPATADDQGHPIGVQLSAPRGSEQLLLDLGDLVVAGWG